MVLFYILRVHNDGSVYRYNLVLYKLLLTIGGFFGDFNLVAL